MSDFAKYRLQTLFGFIFPDDFFAFWEWLKLSSLNLLEDLEIDCLDIFKVFDKNFNENHLFDFLHQFRYYDDPPEYIPLFAGTSDGLHWGYYFDSPDEFPPVIANYYHSDTYEIYTCGDTIFEAIRLILESQFEELSQYLQNYKENSEYFDNKLKKLEQIRISLLPLTHQRTETGRLYLEKYSQKSSRNERIIAPTYHNLGIVATKEQYKDIGEMPYSLEQTQIEKYIALAYQCLQEGYPATALQIAHNFWAGKKSYREQVYDLFRKSYEALGRQKLIPLLEVAIASRQAFDKASEEREIMIKERILEFKEGMKVRFRKQLGEILKIEPDEHNSLKALIQFDNEPKPNYFSLRAYAFHFRIPTDFDFE